MVEHLRQGCRPGALQPLWQPFKFGNALISNDTDMPVNDPLADLLSPRAIREPEACADKWTWNGLSICVPYSLRR